MHRTVLDEVTEGAIDALDRTSAHVVEHANFVHKATNIGMKAAHGLDVMTIHHPIAAGLASVAVVTAITISMSVARQHDEGPCA